MQLSSSNLLLIRELKSLANLAHLARREDIVQSSLCSLDVIIQDLGVERWKREHDLFTGKFKKSERNKTENPNEEEIKQFIWLM